MTRYALAVALTLAGAPALVAQAQSPTITIDEKLAADAHLHVGDRVVLSAQPGGAGGDTALIIAITKQGADPSDVARNDFRVRVHLVELQHLLGYGDRVDRFAVATTSPAHDTTAIRQMNDAAFGFHAYPSAEIAVRTSKTFQVVSRFHRAIGVITIVASSIFLLCILLLKVEERRRDVAALRLMGISRRSVVTSIVLEAALIAVVGSALGTAVGWLASLAINWHYQGVYRTPLAFSIVTPDIVVAAVGLSIVLGVGAGLVAAMRLVMAPPLTLFGR